MRLPRIRIRFRRLAIAAALLLLLAAVNLLLVLRSQWFRDRVRDKLVDVIETATGGRAAIGSFRFDWTTLRARVSAFTLHGTEPADRPPLFRASSVTVGLKIVSMLRRDVDIASLEVHDPRVYLILGEGGRTNVPEPRIKAPDQRNPVETILNLAVGQFVLENGLVEIEGRGPTPFDARGRNLHARLTYDAAVPRYTGDISIQPLDVHLPDYSPIPVAVNLAVELERNRIGVNSGKLATGDSQFNFSGTLDDLASPHATLRYESTVSLADLARILRLNGLESGTAQVAGDAHWAGGNDLTSTGVMRATSILYRDSTARIRGNLAGPFQFRPERVVLDGARLSGSFGGPGPCRPNTVWNCSSSPFEGRISQIVVRGRNLDFDGVAVSALGGSFHGAATLRNLDRYAVKGEIAGAQGRRTVALYSKQPLPWDASASGPVQLEGSLRRKEELRISAELAINPAPDSAPVHGQINATWVQRDRTLDLGRSSVTLPASRADFSGVIGRELRVHFETRDLADVLPALGEDPAAFPVKLDRGTAVFDGTVSGNLEIPSIEGRLQASSFTVSGKPVDSFTGDVGAAPDSVRVHNGTAARGAVRAQFQGVVALDKWKPSDASEIFGNGSIRNAPVSELAAILNTGELPLTGTASATGQFSGTIGKPMLTAAVELVKGRIRGEPFDRFTAHATYAVDNLALTGGELVAGSKHARLSASYTHSPARFDTGRLRFQVTTDAMPLDQIELVRKQRPDVRGTAQITASGELEIAGSTVRLDDLHADLMARSLQLTGQALGDAHLTAQSEGRLLRAHLDADFANSLLRGNGEWRLEGDYPGTATVTFSRLDFSGLHAWFAPATAERLSGSAEGELRLDGPALKPEAIKAQLRVPKIEIGFVPGAGIPGTIALRNSGPLSATLANSVVTIDSIRLVGRATDITIGGKINLEEQRPDVNVNGRVDLSILEEVNPDFSATGMLTAIARVQGTLNDPQIEGRVQFQNAAFNLTDFPNGISKANGVVAFTGDRATIQSFSGETGGGRITLGGFVTYAGGAPIVRLVARADAVRVRYPEGVSTVADADLRLTGTNARSTLTGTVTVLRTGFNPQSDFSSIIAKSAEPVRTPSARTGFLGGLNFDVQITTDPDIEVQSSLTQDIQVEAHLNLRGTPSNPAVVGRINISQGQVLFYGTRYTINQGSIAFYNPLKVEPILDIDLETKARGIDVTLSVTGPLNKLNLTPRSDPPLQFNEIVALLATGRTPTSDPTLLAQQSTAPQSWQQMGASALLGQAIASPVAGRLQRFFGVNKLRIDPTLPGVESNPQARLTLEQQITPDLTMTYITNITNSNPQVIRVEWTVSKQWSIVALREENGVFGLDFFFKRRF